MQRDVPNPLQQAGDDNRRVGVVMSICPPPPQSRFGTVLQIETRHEEPAVINKKEETTCGVNERVKKTASFVIAFGSEIMEMIGLVAYFHELNPQPLCCGHRDSGYAIAGALPVIAMIFSVPAYLLGLVGDIQSESMLTKIKYYRNFVDCVKSAFSFTTVLTTQITYGTSLFPALKLWASNLFTFVLGAKAYYDSKKQLDDVNSSPYLHQDGVAMANPGQVKCGYCGKCCCSLYVLITLTNVLLFGVILSGGNNASDMCMNNYQQYWGTCSCDNLAYSMYSPHYVPVGYGNVTDVETGNYGKVYEYCNSSSFYCCTWEPDPA